MALDSTVGGPNADSYASLTEFKDYADKVGYDYSEKEDSEIEVAMRKATQYLDRAYRGKWKGFRTDRDQSLAWPRTSNADLPTNYLTPSFTTGVIDEDGYEIPTNVIPGQVKEAEFEATFLALDGVDLLPRYERGNAIASKTVKAGPVSTQTTYLSGAPDRDRFLTIEGLLRGLTTGQPGATAGTGRLVRG